MAVTKGKLSFIAVLSSSTNMVWSDREAVYCSADDVTSLAKSEKVFL